MLRSDRARAIESVDVHLDDLGAVDITGIGQGQLNPAGLSSVLGDAEVVVFELRVAKPVPERKQHRSVEAVEVAVADVEPLAVLHLAIHARKPLVRGDIGLPHRKRFCQLAARRASSEQEVGDRRATRLASEVRFENRLG